MILDDKTPQKPDITYPTEWGFKLIGRDKDALEACIKEIMGEKEHHCSPNNTTKNGKFHSYSTRCEVTSQEERDRIFKFFQEHKDVKMVI